MTPATKTKPTKTREEDLAEQLAKHRGVLAEFDQQAADWERQAIAFDERAETLLADFSGPITELPKGVEDNRDKAAHKRRGADDLRKRAQAYAAKNELEAIAAEHDELRRGRIAAEELEAATKEAKDLTGELELLAAWLYQDRLRAEAVRSRYLAAGNRLMDLVQRHPLPFVDSGRYTRLAVQAQEAASRLVHDLGQNPDTSLLFVYLPKLDASDLALPSSLQPRQPVSPSIQQGTRKPVDPNLPKDYDLRMASGAVPVERNPDGTIAGASVRHPFEAQRFAMVPRTDAEELAARRKVAKKLDAELEQVEAGA